VKQISLYETRSPALYKKETYHTAHSENLNRLPAKL
jgi:hypothetical protein